MVREMKRSFLELVLTQRFFRGATGSWIVEAPQAGQPMNLGGSAVWVPTSGGSIPEGAFVGGQDNGEGLFVGRAQHEGALLPGE
jgi:hypothetical protein